MELHTESEEFGSSDRSDMSALCIAPGGYTRSVDLVLDLRLIKTHKTSTSQVSTEQFS
jgi:hypothetical protein